MSDEVDYLLSILGKEGYAAMDCWMPTHPADKNKAGKFLNYLKKLHQNCNKYVHSCTECQQVTLKES